MLLSMVCLDIFQGEDIPEFVQDKGEGEESPRTETQVASGHSTGPNCILKEL